MALIDRNGRVYDDPIAYAESKGYSRIPLTASYRAPDGRTVSRGEAAHIAVTDAKAGNLYPDQELLAEFRTYGYTGPEASEAAADNFAEQEMADYPGVQLTSPESILGQYKDVVEQYGLPGYEKAMAGADELSNIARSTGFSPYAKAQLEQQKLEESGLRDNLQAQLGGARSTALSNLASSGGYDSGARERVLRGTGLQSLIGGQQIGRQGFQTRAGIGASDALYKQNTLASLPSMYSNVAQTGTAMWNPYLNQASTEQGYDYSTKKYNIDKDVEKFKLQKQLESSARQGYAESPNPYSYSSDLYN